METSNINKVGILMSALAEGKILCRQSADRYEYLFIDMKHHYLECKGWESDFGKAQDRLEEILFSPQLWEITEYTIEDRPWSK